MKKKLPIFEFIIDDSNESGVKAVSIVSDPAFGIGTINFAKEKPKFIELKIEGKKQIVAGFAILPNVPVYRIDSDTGMEYMGYFSAETIEKIVDKYHKEMLTNQVNLEHNENGFIYAYLIEDFIVNSQPRVEDLKAKGLSHPNALGGWYTAFKIKDAEVFQRIVNSGSDTGLSIEAYLDKVMVEFNVEVKNNFINNKVNQTMKKVNKSLKEKILAIFTEVEKLERALCPELAFEIEWTEVGAPVSKVVVNENGEESLQPVGQGEFATEYGVVVVDEASNLVEVRDLPAEVIPEVEIELPEVPEVSGNTSISGSTESVLAVSGNTSGSTETVSGSTEQPLSGMTKAGIEKSILEIVGTNDGEYTVLVKVVGGVVVEATAQSMVDLMLSKQQEIDVLKLSVTNLQAKLKEPITEPILTPEVPALDFSKMTTYEKLMYNRGIKPV